MNVIDWCINIFHAVELDQKLISSKLITDFSFKKVNIDLSHPSRPKNLEISPEKIKFPKIPGFKDPKIRAKALSFFANHELEAIEMMVAALIRFGSGEKPGEFEKIARGIVSSIDDEQKHLKMYINRIKSLGHNFGDFPLNDFFWKQFNYLNSFSDFFSLMSLTFEAANLDFCLFYEKVFQNIGDSISANIMKEVYIDELNHVRLGLFWLNKWKEDDSLWNYYLSHLPEKISPERSKGINFSLDSRKLVGFDEEYISSLMAFEDDFKIPVRKPVKNVLSN